MLKNVSVTKPKNAATRIATPTIETVAMLRQSRSVIGSLDDGPAVVDSVVGVAAIRQHLARCGHR